MKSIRFLFIWFGIVLLVGMVGAAIVFFRGVKPDVLENVFAGLESPTRVFRNAEFGISFRYPREWEERFIAPNGILFSGKDGTTLILVLTKRNNEESLDEMTEKNIRELQESAVSAGTNIDKEAVEPILLGAQPARRFAYHAQKNETPIDGIQVWTVNGTKEYIMTFASPRDVFSAAVQTFQNVLESVEIKQ
ncbi:hypothetical protein HY732_02995 [Candidatus Uhrbacteria bacterium]|nr:hypothetical protein [Candidatus Uhrbacteria bacterium]